MHLFASTDDEAMCAGQGSGTCAICQEDYKAEETIKRLPCMHTFHVAHIDLWLQEKQECPLCGLAL